MLSIPKNLESAYQLIQSGNYDDALAILEKHAASGADHILLSYMIGQCNLALGKFEEAKNIYQNFLILNDPALLPVQAEAELVLGKYQEALQHFEACLKIQSLAGDVLFLTSIAAYKSGNILKTKVFLSRAVQSGFEWFDDIPVDGIAGYVCQRYEFNDLEHIYLDVCEQSEDENLIAQNRWFSINIPIYEFFSATENQQQKAKVIIELVSDNSLSLLLDNGKTELEHIINDLAKSETDARFGLEAIKLFNNNDFNGLAKIMLALFLELVNQSGELFGLEKDFVKTSQLQDLVLLLPVKIAVILLFLYAACHPVVQIKPIEKININENILAGLIAQSFLIFYQEMKYYNSKLI